MIVLRIRQLLLCLIFLVPACDNFSNQPTLRIAHNTWTGYESIPLAISEKMFKGVDVVNYRVNSATEVIRAFEQGIVDVAAVTLDEAILIQSKQREPIQIITVMDISHGGDAIIAKRNIASIRDLKNKRVGLESTALGAFFISRALETDAEISIEHLNIIPVLYNQHFSSFMSDKVDAIVTFEPVKSRILKNKGHVLFDSTAIKNEIVDVLIIKQATAEKKSEQIEALVSGYFKTLEFINIHKDKAMLKMANFQDISISDFKIALSGLRIPDREENHLLLSGRSPPLMDTINKLQKFMLKNKIINKPIDAASLINNQFLPKQDD